MTITLPFLLITLHLSHMGFTLGLTFIFSPPDIFLIIAVGNSAFGDIVGGDLYFDFVSLQNSYIVDA